jgi:WD40 repeat protein
MAAATRCEYGDGGADHARPRNEPVIILRGATGRIELLCLSPDGRGVVAALEGGLQVWDEVTPNGQPARNFHWQSVRAVQFTPDGQKLLVARWNDVVLANRATGTIEISLPMEGERQCGFGGCALTTDGEFLLMIAGDTRDEMQGRFSCRLMTTPTVPLWSGLCRGFLYAPPVFVSGGARFVLFEWVRMRGVFLVTRETVTGTTVSESGHFDHYDHPVASDDGRWIAAREGNRVAIFHGVHFADKPIVLKNDGRPHFTGLAFHPSGRYLAATSNDATVKLYDTETWSVAKVFTWEIGRMRSVAFSPDGMLAAAGSDKGRVIVWDFDL